MPDSPVRRFLRAYGLEEYTELVEQRVREGWPVEDVMQEMVEAGEIDLRLELIAHRYGRGLSH